MCKELQPHEFTDRLEPIFRHVEQEAGQTNGNWKHVVTVWRKWMELGLARTWEAEGCILGALFAPHLFSGNVRAYVHFWFALPEARGTGRPLTLLEACEQAAKKLGCQSISSSAYTELNPMKTRKIYEHRGYVLSESVFTKAL